MKLKEIREVNIVDFIKPGDIVHSMTLVEGKTVSGRIIVHKDKYLFVSFSEHKEVKNHLSSGLKDKNEFITEELQAVLFNPYENRILYSEDYRKIRKSSMADKQIVLNDSFEKDYVRKMAIERLSERAKDEAKLLMKTLKRIKEIKKLNEEN